MSLSKQQVYIKLELSGTSIMNLVQSWSLVIVQVKVKGTIEVMLVLCDVILTKIY